MKRALGITDAFGRLLGAAAAPFFALTTKLRRARTFHPRGDLLEATVTVDPSVPADARAIAERLAGPAVVRLSSALSKHRAQAFDVLGCALRFGGYAGDQDLLLATIKRPWSLGFAPLTTKTRDYLANDYFGVSPFTLRSDTRGGEARGYFRLRAERGGRGGATTHANPNANANANEVRRERGAARDSRMARRKILASDVRAGAVLVLEVAPGPRGPFAPLVRIRLDALLDADRPELRFDPFRASRGIAPRGLVHGLRRSVYPASHRARQ